MKIILANKFYYPRGGDCIHVIALKKLLEQHGHQVAIFTMQHSENLPSEYSDFWVSAVSFSSANNRLTREVLFRPIWSKEVRIEWIKLLIAFQPDLVHLHNIHTQISPIIAEESWKRSIPVYWTLHDYKLICPSYTLQRNGMVCEECLTDKKKVIQHLCIKGSLAGSLMGYVETLKWSRSKLENYVTAFISPSQFLKNKMEDAGYKASQINHLYNFTEAEKFKAIIEKEDYYVFLGRLSIEKGLHTLLKAATSKPQFKLVIIGDGPLRLDLEKKYSANHIKFLGFLPWQEIEKLLGRAKFMVLPSEWYENNPLSIIESLALGTPVLGANIGGIPELINNNNGRLFEPGNVNELASKIDEMFNINNWNSLSISENAQRKFDSESYYTSLMEIYKSKNILIQ